MNLIKKLETNSIKNTTRQQLKKGLMCDFICPGINIIATDNYQNLNEFILTEVSHMATGNKIMCAAISGINTSILDGHNYIKVDTPCIEDIFEQINQLVESSGNNIIIITNFEDMKFVGEDIYNPIQSTARASIISQFFKRIIPILYINNSMLIIGHTSEKYKYINIEYDPYETIIPYIDKPVPEIPVGPILYMSSILTKVIDDDGNIKVEQIRNKLK